jgi:hypothetical protein
MRDSIITITRKFDGQTYSYSERDLRDIGDGCDDCGKFRGASLRIRLMNLMYAHGGCGEYYCDGCFLKYLEERKKRYQDM